MSSEPPALETPPTPFVCTPMFKRLIAENRELKARLDELDGTLVFNKDQDLAAFLCFTDHGKMVLERVRAMQDEIVAAKRYRQRNVLVKAYQDGLVEVYGPSFVNATIAFLGWSVTDKGHEIRREQRLDEQLPDNYRQINFPGMQLASSLRGHDNELRVV